MKRLKATKGRHLGGRELCSGPCRALTSWKVEMTKTSIETSSDPFRMLNKKNSHEMIGTFPTFLPRLAEEPVRRFIKTTHVSHDERNKIAGHYTVALEVQILTDSIIKNRDSTDAFEGGASVLNAGRAGS